MWKDAGQPGAKGRWGLFVGAAAVAGAVACLTHAQKPVPNAPPIEPAPKAKSPLGGGSTVLSPKKENSVGRPSLPTPRKKAVDRNAVSIPRITTTIHSGQIADALRQIAEAGPRLGRTQRTELLALAMNELAQRVESTKDLSGAQKLIGEVGSRADVLKEDMVNRVLAALEARLAYQLLARDLQAMNDWLAKKQWGQAAVLAQSRLGHTDLTAEMKSNLGSVIQVTRQLQALEQIQRVLHVAERNRPAETVEAFRDLQVEPLAAPLRNLVRALRGLTEVWAAGENPDRRPPNVARLKESLADFRAGSGKAALTVQLQVDLAAKWFLDGFPREARELLPESNGSTEQALGFVRDFQALIEGKGGTVRTWPARQALQGGTGSAKAVRTPPPGIGKLLPAERRTDWRPPGPDAEPVRPSALDEVAQREKPLREKLQTAFLDERESVQQQADDVQDQLKTLIQQQTRQEEDLQQLYAELEGQLQRPNRLSAAERALAWHGYRRGHKAPVIAQALRNYPLAQ
jgi:hypothetical protein